MRTRPGAEIWLLQKPTDGQPAEALLLRKRHGVYPAFWQPATGGQEPGETILQTAIREAFEETAVQLVEGQLIVMRENQIVEMPKSDFVWSGTVFYTWLTPEQSAQVAISDEHDGHGWFTFEQAAKVLKWPINLENLEYLMRRF